MKYKNIRTKAAFWGVGLLAAALFAASPAVIAFAADNSSIETHASVNVSSNENVSWLDHAKSSIGDWWQNGPGLALGHIIAPGLHKDTSSDGHASVTAKAHANANANLGKGSDKDEDSKGGDNDNDSDNDNASTTPTETSTPTPTETSTSTSSPTATSTATVSISGISSPAMLKVGETGTWSVHASNSGNDPMSYSVLWGDESIFRAMVLNVTGQAFVQTATFTHAYAKPGVYTVRFTVKDDTTGVSRTSSATVRVIAYETPITVVKPLTVSGLIAKVGSTSINLSWNTNIAADSTVYYATSSPVNVDSASTTQVSDTNMAVNHTADVSGLEASTTYYFVVKSTDGTANNQSYIEFSLTTGN